MQDVTVKLKFRELSLGTLWLSVKEEWTVISKMANRILLPFSTPVYQNWGSGADWNSPKQGAAKNHWWRSGNGIVCSFSMYQSPVLNGPGTDITLEQ
jgi:hypothetical protein